MSAPCHREPLVEVIQGDQSILYGPVKPATVDALLDRHFGKPATAAADWTVSSQADRKGLHLSRPPGQGDDAKLCGIIDPHSLDDYLAHDGYQALRSGPGHDARRNHPGRQGRTAAQGGGAGFPTGTKWEIGHKQPGRMKFLICNADEGDPGAFMDRTMIEGDPHRLLEGMLIARAPSAPDRLYLHPRRVPAGGQGAA